MKTGSMPASGVSREPPNPRRTLIYTHGGGRLGNQLLRFAHLLAWAMEHPGSVRLINLAFAPYAKGWETWARHPGCGYPGSIPSVDRWIRVFLGLPEPVRRRLGWRLQRAVHRVGTRMTGGRSLVAEEDFQGGHVFLDGGFLSRLDEADPTFLSGWRIANWDLLALHESKVRDLFRPEPTVVREAERTVARLRNQADFVVALHLRRGDYREFDGGRFFFDLDAYRTWAQQLVVAFPDRKVGLLVCGDEPVGDSIFDGLAVPWAFSGGSIRNGGCPVVSLTEMSMSDLVVGPPSTFSVFGAFIGGVPVLPLGCRDQTINRDHVVYGGLIAAHRHPVLSSVVF